MASNEELTQATREVADELVEVQRNLGELAAAIVALKSRDDRVVDTLQDAQETVTRAAEVEGRLKAYQRRLFLALIVPLIALLFVGGINLYSSYKAREAADSAQFTAAYIKDCTDPNGECFKKNRVSLGESINKIVTGVNDGNAKQLDAALQQALTHFDEKLAEQKKLFCDSLRVNKIDLPTECEGT